MLGLGLVKKAPRTLATVLLFIAGTLLVFLLLGCIDNAPAFSDVYVIEFQFNPHSGLYDSVTSSYTSHNQSIADMKLRSGYLNVCGTSKVTGTICTPKANMTALSEFTSLNLYNGNETLASVDPVELASAFSKGVINPFLLCISLACTALAVVASVTPVSPVSPKGAILSTVVLGLTCASWLFWTIGAIWQQVAAISASTMVNEATMTILKGTPGGRATGMTWTVFAFHTLAIIIILAVRRRENLERVRGAMAKEDA
uniref:ARAD1D27258p n=1 Tax=Blastobotrys adeninivorans TaxID=409370 RepID=A0A060TAY1_BLAAD